MANLNPSRESVTTINEDGSRMFLHPADVSGKFTLLRRLSAVVLIAVYVLLPWIKINGYPAVFFDVMQRRFHFFGMTIATQDLWLGFFLVSGLGFALFFITSLLGRIWCGWACPQTVFLEHVFRRVERWLEGDAVARRQLDAAPWNNHKIVLRGLKHFIFLCFAGLIAHIFLSYFVSIPTLYQWMTQSPLEHWGAFVFVFVITGILYFNFAWFREQLCLIICPYGRLQSALTDDNSIIIGYDEKRGEPRGPAKQTGIGDCIDCNRCVAVCPTGIDIRQGMQIECIGCANCIDACDAIMTKLNRPKGLVRYDSLNGLEGKKTQILRPRIFAYLVLMLCGIIAMVWTLQRLDPATLQVQRMTGQPYYWNQQVIRNQYLVRLINKQSEPVTFTLNLANAPSGTQLNGFDEGVTLEPMAEEVRPLVVSIAEEQYAGSFPLTIRITGQPGAFVIDQSIQFLGPNPQVIDLQAKEDRP